MESSSRSLLAQALEQLMTAAKMSQKDWAGVLGVTPGAVSQWLNDVTLPQAQHIRGILCVVGPGGPRKHPLDGAGPAVENFYRIAELPPEEVTPHHANVGKNIGHYLALELYKGLQGRITAMVYARTLRKNEANFQKIAEFLNTLE